MYICVYIFTYIQRERERERPKVEPPELFLHWSFSRTALAGLDRSLPAFALFALGSVALGSLVPVVNHCTRSDLHYYSYYYYHYYYYYY